LTERKKEKKAHSEGDSFGVLALTTYEVVFCHILRL